MALVSFWLRVVSATSPPLLVIVRPAPILASVVLTPMLAAIPAATLTAPSLVSALGWLSSVLLSALASSPVAVSPPAAAAPLAALSCAASCSSTEPPASASPFASAFLPPVALAVAVVELEASLSALNPTLPVAVISRSVVAVAVSTAVVKANEAPMAIESPAV